jgi:hypothetical protein
MVMIMFVGVAIFGAYLVPDILYSPGLPEQSRGAEGGLAPKDLRGTFGGSDTRTDVQSDIDAYNAKERDAAVDNQSGAVVATPTAVSLPLNSAGQPVISAEQQQQMNLSLQLAEQEGNAAADAAMKAQRDAALADAASRAPDVSYEDAKEMLHRDPCSVPRANPHTCKQGLFKPTPVN